MEQFVDLLQEFLYNLALVALPIIAGFVIAILKAWLSKILQDVENSKPELADAIKLAVSLAVQAAEGMELSGFISDKKQYALEIVQVWLDEKGWDEVDIDILEAAIEAEVLSVFNGEKVEGFSRDQSWNAW